LKNRIITGELPPLTDGKKETLRLTYRLFDLADFYSENLNVINPVKKVPELLSINTEGDQDKSYTVINLYYANDDQLANFISVIVKYLDCDDFMRINTILIVKKKVFNIVVTNLLPSFVLKNNQKNTFFLYEYLMLVSTQTYFISLVLRIERKFRAILSWIMNVR